MIYELTFSITRVNLYKLFSAKRVRKQIEREKFHFDDGPIVFRPKKGFFDKLSTKVSCEINKY